MIMNVNWLYGVKETHGGQIWLFNACLFAKFDKSMSELWLKGNSPYFLGNSLIFRKIRFKLN
jgi:hypothetical protein